MLGGAAAFMFFQSNAPQTAWLVAGITLICFLIIVLLHNRVLDGVKRNKHWRFIKQTNLARMNLDWALIPDPLDLGQDPLHPFEHDLNLTGQRSIHQLITTASSRGGAERLAAWLLQDASEQKQIIHRQELVQELASNSVFRERLTLAGRLIADKSEQPWDGEELIQWVGATDTPFHLLGTLKLLFGLAGLNIILVFLHISGILPPVWGYTIVVYGLIYLFKHRVLGGSFNDAFYIESRLKRFRAVWEYIEDYKYHRMPAVADLCKSFSNASSKPSTQLAHIEKIAGLASLQMAAGGLMAPILNILMPWDLFFTYRLHVAKRRIRHELPGWLNIWYDLEALSSLATFADLHPDYIYPEIYEHSENDIPVLTTEALGHPLLGDSGKVKNDFALDALGRVVIITGSNMSGKSTFLRTLGVNLRLAYAGGPVDAAQFQTTLFRVFTCLQVSDSINDGISFFYAEVKRLKALLTAFKEEHSLPLFFLVDEIFRGTNNRERLIGSRSFIRALAGGHGAGLIATHDLELVHLEDEIPHIQNYHFREEIEDGKMVFDYLLHDGPCPTSNALRIMEMEGLPVEKG